MSSYPPTLSLVSGPTEAAVHGAVEQLRIAPSSTLVEVVGASSDRLRAAYLRSSSGPSAGGSVVGGPLAIDPARSRPVAFMFPGLGDHYLYMAEHLYRDVPAFRQEIDRCAELLKPELGLDLRDVIYPPRESPPREGGETPAAPAGLDLRKMLGRDARAPTANERRLNETRIAQPALFVVEYALTKLLGDWGVTPASMVGYSLGEYVAACLAGVLSLTDSLAFVARRAQLIETLPPGAMLAVALPEDQVRCLLGAHVAISAVNGPELCVVAGPPEEVDAFEKQLKERGHTSRRVRSTHAFHTPMMAPLAEKVTALAKGFALQAPTIPYASNVTGRLISAHEATDPGYWAAHLTSAVRFSDGLRTLASTGPVFVEAGPGQTLSSIAITSPDLPTTDRVVAAAMRNAFDAQPDTAVLLQALSRLWVAGAAVAWERLPSRAVDTNKAPSTDAPAAVPALATASDSLDTPTERQLAEVWQQLFRGAAIGPTTSFFTLGGNSLTATRLVQRVEKTFAVKVSLKHVYRAPLLREMAATIDDLRANPNAPARKASAAVKQPTGASTPPAPRLVLPNGLTVAHQNEAETRHFYDDIFAHRSYVRHGITIPDGACVFDVGANIGLFSLFASREAKNVRVFSFEPSPPTFALLQANLAEHAPLAKALNCGVSNVAGEASFTFYPRSSGMSSFHPDEAEEKRNLRTIIANQQRVEPSGGAELVKGYEAELLDVRFEASVFTAKLRRLSDVIREYAIDRIDLLKIDVQKSEAEVIDGIDEADWPKISQIVLEAHDSGGRVEALRARLASHGFSVVVLQDELYVGTDIYNIYATREVR